MQYALAITQPKEIIPEPCFCACNVFGYNSKGKPWTSIQLLFWNDKSHGKRPVCEEVGARDPSNFFVWQSYVLARRYMNLLACGPLGCRHLFTRSWGWRQEGFACNCAAPESQALSPLRAFLLSMPRGHAKTLWVPHHALVMDAILTRTLTENDLCRFRSASVAWRTCSGFQIDSPSLSLYLSFSLSLETVLWKQYSSLSKQLSNEKGRKLRKMYSNRKRQTWWRNKCTSTQLHWNMMSRWNIMK